MSFSQKKKRSILPIAGNFIEEELILESIKPRNNKSLLDFKSPKLNRLKNFIKSPVQKTYNKYKQFQDNDEDNSSVDIKSTLENLIKRQSIESKNIDTSNDSTINHESKDISQTSLLTTISIVPIDSYPKFPSSGFLSTQRSNFVDEMLTNSSFTTKSANTEFTNPNVSSTGEINNKSKHASFKEAISQNRIITKSASIEVLFDPKSIDSVPNVSSVDKIDGTNSNIVTGSNDNKMSSRWNPTVVDIETTEIMLESLDDHIKNTKEKIIKELSAKDQMVDKLITNFSSNPPDNKSSKALRKEFETKNKNTGKLLEKSQMELEQLEFKRLIVNQEGIPWGVNPADYVKNINKKDRNKKKGAQDLKPSPGPLSKFIKSNSQKSASAENISHLISEKKLSEVEIKQFLLPKYEDLKKPSENYIGKSKHMDDSSRTLPTEFTNFSKIMYLNQNSKKSGSAGANSAVSLEQQCSEKVSVPKKSKSNSISSGAGKENMDSQKTLKNQSFSAHSIEEVSKNEDASFNRYLTLQNEILSLKIELQEMRSGFHRFQCEMDTLRLDMNTNSDLNSQKMQNSIENIDRLERMLDLLRQQCQIEFCAWKDDFRNLEAKLDYRLTTTKRDLQDNIDSCNNSISLIEKRTEQLPFMSNRAGGKSDVKIITDHLCNLIVSLIAFIMLLISSGFHLLIRFLNMGATICRHRNTLLPPVIIVGALIISSIKWSLWNKLYTFLSESRYLHGFLAGS